MEKVGGWEERSFFTVVPSRGIHSFIHSFINGSLRAAAAGNVFRTAVR